MTLKWFPSEENVRNVFARLTKIGLSIGIAAALYSLVRTFGVDEWGIIDGSQYVIASFAMPMKFDPVERKSDEDFLTNLQKIAFLDPLTGLKNRRGLEGQVSSILSSGYKHENRAAFVLLDLDRFKQINDTFGHDAGDRILTGTARRLNSLICDNPAMSCYRLGGDEFLIIWSNGPSFAEVDAFCDRLKACLLEPHFIDKSEIKGGGSVGVTWQNETDTMLEMMLKRADMALYKAKSVTGTAHRFYCKQIETEMQSKREIEHLVRDIVLERRFDVRYEPIAHVDNLKVNYFAINIFEQGTDSNLLANEEYVTALNETGLIIPFNRNVLEHVAQDVATWSKHKRAVIPMSSSQLLDPGFVSFLADTLLKFKVACHQLVIAYDTLERSENPELIETNLRGLVDLGVRIASYGLGGDIGNFGARGGSKQRYLILKENWVKNVTEEEGSFELLASLIKLAQGLGLSVIVQGVETTAQTQHLSRFPQVLIEGSAVDAVQPTS